MVQKIHLNTGFHDDDDVIRRLFIKLLQMIGYFKHFDSTKAMSFKVSDNKLFKSTVKYVKESAI